MLGEDFDFCQFFDEIGWEFGGAIERAAGFADVGGLVGEGVFGQIGVFAGREKLADARGSKFFVNGFSQERHVLGAAFGPFGGKLRALVPAEQAGDGVEEADLFDCDDELVVGLVGVHRVTSLPAIRLRCGG